jgi:hypothetical protein
MYLFLTGMYNAKLFPKVYLDGNDFGTDPRHCFLLRPWASSSTCGGQRRLHCGFKRRRTSHIQMDLCFSQLGERLTYLPLSYVLNRSSSSTCLLVFSGPFL